MKELSNYYKMEKIAITRPQKETLQKQARLTYQSTEDEGIEKMIKSMMPNITPFNYEPYMGQFYSTSIHYDTRLSDDLKEPDTRYQV